MQDLLNIARTTLSSKILTHDKDHFAELAVDAVLRLKGSTNLESINIIKKPGGTLRVSERHSEAPFTYLAEVLRAAVCSWSIQLCRKGPKAIDDQHSSVVGLMPLACCCTYMTARG